MNDKMATSGAGGELAQAVTSGLEVLRIDHDTMQKAATLKPRDRAQVLKSALSELDVFPEEAKGAWYSIPYQDGKGGQVRVEGPSIRAAMPLARLWGNCVVGARITDDAPEYTDVEARFLDYETNFMLTRPHRVSKLLKRRDGKIQKLDPQRQLMAVQAGVSKAIRNAICDGIPRAFVHRYVSYAKQIVAGQEPDKKMPKKAVDACVAEYKALGVSKEMLELKLAKKSGAWTGNDRAELVSWYTALSENSATIEMLFGQTVKEVEEVDAPKTETPKEDKPAIAPAEQLNKEEAKEVVEKLKEKVQKDDYEKKKANALKETSLCEHGVESGKVCVECQDIEDMEKTNGGGCPHGVAIGGECKKCDSLFS